MTFYYQIQSEGYIEAEDEAEAEEILEEKQVCELDNIEVSVKLDDDHWEEDSYESLGLKRSDFM